jgi:hypothetical protein
VNYSYRSRVYPAISTNLFNKKVGPQKGDQVRQMPGVFSPSLQAIDQQVGYHGTPRQDTHCIGACTDESLDPEEFLYILEEHYHIPTGFVQLQDGVNCPISSPCSASSKLICLEPWLYLNDSDYL